MVGKHDVRGEPGQRASVAVRVGGNALRLRNHLITRERWTGESSHRNGPTNLLNGRTVSANNRTPRIADNNWLRFNEVKEVEKHVSV